MVTRTGRVVWIDTITPNTRTRRKPKPWERYPKYGYVGSLLISMFQAIWMIDL